MLTAQAAVNSSEANAQERERRWYGQQNLIVDAAALGVGAIGAAIIVGAPEGYDGPNLGALLLGGGLVAIGGAAYLLGSPIVHVAHDRPAIAAASFGLRILPAVPILALAKANVIPLLVTLTGLTAAVAIVVDDFALAYERRPQSTLAVLPSADGTAGMLVWSSLW